MSAAAAFFERFEASGLVQGRRSEAPRRSADRIHRLPGCSGGPATEVWKCVMLLAGEGRARPDERHQPGDVRGHRVRRNLHQEWDEGPPGALRAGGDGGWRLRAGRAPADDRRRAEARPAEDQPGHRPVPGRARIPSRTRSRPPSVLPLRRREDSKRQRRQGKPVVVVPRFAPRNRSRPDRPDRTVPTRPPRSRGHRPGSGPVPGATPRLGPPDRRRAGPPGRGLAARLAVPPDPACRPGSRATRCNGPSRRYWAGGASSSSASRPWPTSTRVIEAKRQKWDRRAAAPAAEAARRAEAKRVEAEAAAKDKAPRGAAPGRLARPERQPDSPGDPGQGQGGAPRRQVRWGACSSRSTWPSWPRWSGSK